MDGCFAREKCLPWKLRGFNVPRSNRFPRILTLIQEFFTPPVTHPHTENGWSLFSGGFPSMAHLQGRELRRKPGKRGRMIPVCENLPMFGRGHRRKTHRTHLLNNLYQALGSGQQNRTNQIIYACRAQTMSRVPHIFHAISLKTPQKFNIGALLHPFNELLDRKCGIKKQMIFGPWGNPSSSPSSG